MGGGGWGIRIFQWTSRRWRNLSYFCTPLRRASGPLQTHPFAWGCCLLRALLENKVWLAGQCAGFALFVCMALYRQSRPQPKNAHPDLIFSVDCSALKLVYLYKC